jgi:hypothetical protein
MTYLDRCADREYNLTVFGIDGRSQRVDPDGPTGLWTTHVGGSTVLSR